MSTVNEKLERPKILDLDKASQENLFAEVANADLSEAEKIITQECLKFPIKLVNKLKNPKTTLRHIKKLLALHEEKIKKALLNL